MTEEWRAFITWWGAGLSTFLALVKLWELWRNRVRIEVACMLDGNPQAGNDINIRNLTSHPVILGYWELVWLSGHWPFRSESPLHSSEEAARDVQIGAHSSLKLSFVEQNHFDWGVEAMKGRRIYIRLYFAGERPILRKVHG